MFDSNPFGADTAMPPLSASEFRDAVTEQYGGDDVRECIEYALDGLWPVVRDHSDPPTVQPRSAVPSGDIAPTLDEADEYEWYPAYREYQRGAVVDILANLYVADKDVVLLSAPTGAGKSLILYAAAAVVEHVGNRQSFFTTPLNTLIDQVDDDEFIGDDVLTIKGKNNYSCIHRQDRGTSVDKAVCQRVSDFDCKHKEIPARQGGCPYYGRKVEAPREGEVVTNMSYLMANSMIPEGVDSKLDPRELLIVDECQNIEDFALQFVTVVFSDRAMPDRVSDLIARPPRTDDIEALADWLRDEVLPPVTAEIDSLDKMSELTEEQADDLEQLQRFARKAQNFLHDVQNHHWVADTDYDTDEYTIEFKPIFIGRFLGQYLWSQGHKVVLSSATIPRGGFLEEVGLDDRDVGEVEVESTFPPERRPIVTDQDVGKMTKSERDRTIPKMAQKIASLADKYEGYRGFVHCHSYKIASRIYERLPQDVKARTRVQDSQDREAALDAWLDAPVDEEGLFGSYDGDDYNDDGRHKGGQVFLSVAMDEGISLDDWRARWQVVAKAAYPFLGEPRVEYRMDELDDWTWYSNNAVVNFQQAVGRGMRSKDDFCITYVLDSSATQLLDRNEWQFEDWFLDGVDVEPCDDIESLE